MRREGRTGLQRLGRTPGTRPTRGLCVHLQVMFLPPRAASPASVPRSQELRARGVRIEHAAEQLEPRTTHTPLMKQILPW